MFFLEGNACFFSKEFYISLFVASPAVTATEVAHPQPQPAAGAIDWPEDMLQLL